MGCQAPAWQRQRSCLQKRAALAVANRACHPKGRCCLRSLTGHILKSIFYKKCKRSYIHSSVTVGASRKWAAKLLLGRGSGAVFGSELCSLWQTELATPRVGSACEVLREISLNIFFTKSVSDLIFIQVLL